MAVPAVNIAATAGTISNKSLFAMVCSLGILTDGAKDQDCTLGPCSDFPKHIFC